MASASQKRASHDDKLTTSHQPTSPKSSSPQIGSDSTLPTQRSLLAPSSLTPPQLQQLQRTIGNQAVSRLLGAGRSDATIGAPSIQRKLRTATDTYTTEEDLNLGVQKPSLLVKMLLETPEEYFIADDKAPDFTSNNMDEFRVVGKRKYLLGESHDDNGWAARTAPWSYIPKMREGIKGFSAQSPEEQRAIDDSNVEPQDQGLPLEDMHNYALTKLIIVTQLMGGYEDVKLTGPETIKDHLDEVFSLFMSYYKVGKQWYDISGHPKPKSRADHLMNVGLANGGEPAFTTLRAVKMGTKAANTLSKKEVADIQTLLSKMMGRLIELIDTRPTGGLFNSKQGVDPIPNRKALTKFTKPGKDWEDGMVKGLAEGNVLREAAMIKNIKAAPAPLFVQVGNAHVDNLAAGVGMDALPIKKDKDFGDFKAPVKKKSEDEVQVMSLADLLGPQDNLLDE